jgi:dTDP-4-dehydrorhamnose 3,5-epimerase
MQNDSHGRCLREQCSGMVSPTQVFPMPMKVTTTSLPGVLILEPRVFGDARGFFLESYNTNTMAELGIREQFVQDNHSYSGKDVIRGLHYQMPHPQGKLVRVAVGEILDVIVDLRRSSPTFGKWHGVKLSGENFNMLWIPPGFAHGFHVLSDGAHVLYKATDFYHPEWERTLAWNDPELNIDWQLQGEPIISAKDAKGVLFQDAEKFE